MRSILISLLLCAIYLHAHAADLFGNEQVNEGEMAYADQKDLNRLIYNSIFNPF